MEKGALQTLFFGFFLEMKNGHEGIFPTFYSCFEPLAWRMPCARFWRYLVSLPGWTTCPFRINYFKGFKSL